jgi:hypothetical protein
MIPKNLPGVRSDPTGKARARVIIGQISGVLSLLPSLVLGTLVGTSFAFQTT